MVGIDLITYLLVVVLVLVVRLEKVTEEVLLLFCSVPPDKCDSVTHCYHQFK